MPEEVRDYSAEGLYKAAYDVLLDIAEDPYKDPEERTQAAEAILLNPPILDTGGDGLPVIVMNINGWANG